MGRIALLAATLAGLAAVTFAFRRWLLLGVLALVVGGPLAEPADEGPGVEWFDDYYTVEVLDPGTFAIAEPRFSQRNVNYLIVGDTRAVLFDSGPGVRDIRNVVAHLTSRPVTAVASHLHYDHIGYFESFERVALVDLPSLRERTQDGSLRPSFAEHLGFLEGRPRPSIRVTEWLAPDSMIDLGGRALQVILTPGHAPESISLYDAQQGRVFAGDYLTPEGLLAFVPGSSLGDYRRTAIELAERLPEGTQFLSAHRGTRLGAPVMSYRDLLDLRSALEAIRAGELASENFFPRVFRVNAGLVIYSDLPAFERWD